MKIEYTLADIVQKLEEGQFPNESSISQGIVLPILSHLGWNVFDTASVWPEYSTREGRVDFALCAPSKKPKCFLEVKQPGKAEGGVRQALEYAFHEGAQFVTLTDGKTWSFYLPAEQGSYEDRRVFMLDLFERSTSESAEVLHRYLDQQRIASGDALETARKEYRNKNRRLAARESIPESWRELVGRKDKQLIDLLTDAVESKSGIRPHEKDVLGFLSQLLTTNILSPVHTPKSRSGSPSSNTNVPRNTTSARKKLESVFEKISPPVTPTRREIPRQRTRNQSIVLRGKHIDCRNAAEAMACILSELAKDDSTFLQRCFEHPEFRSSNNIKYLARSVADLNPNRPELAERAHKELPGGWVVYTYNDNAKKRVIIMAAAEVAGMTFGRDIIIDF